MSDIENDQTPVAPAEPTPSNTNFAPPPTSNFDEVEETVMPTQEQVPPTVTEANAQVADVEETRRPERPHYGNVTQTAELYQPAPNWDDNAPTLILPSEEREWLMEATNTFPVVGKDTDEETNQWIATIEAGMAISTNNWMTKGVKRPGSKYVQAVQGERGPLSIARPKMEDFKGAKLTGERALRRVYSSIGVGSQLTFPLWHSGFWVTLRSPSEAELLELEHRITNSKVLLGRRTSGALFSNMSVAMNADLMDFIEEHYYDSSLVEKENWRQHLDTRDLPHLIWGLACTIWQNGFQYIRAVVGDTASSDRIIKETLNLGKLQWTDTSMLTPWQITHMSHRASSSMSTTDVIRYKNEFIYKSKKQVVELGNDLRVVLKVPTVDEFLNSGQRWVDSIVVATDRVFGMNQDPDDRNRYILDQARASVMRQYAHWVEAIEIGEDVIEKPEDLEAALNVYSSQQEIRDKYVEGIQAFMDEILVSVIAVTTAEPNETNKLPRFPRLLPIDPATTFFILLSRKIALIRGR